MGLLSQCFCCETWKKKNDRYRKQSSPSTAAYLPGNIEKSHFVYSPKLSAREDYLFRPSIQQLAQTFAIENLKLDKPIGSPLSSCYLDLLEISLEPPTGSLQSRTRSLAPGTGSLELGTGSPEATNIKVIHVKPALDLWKNDESTGFKDDDNDESDLEKLVPSEVIVGPQGTKLLKVKPVKKLMYLVQETGAEPNSQLTTYLSQLVDHHSKEKQEQLKEPISRLNEQADNYRSLTDTNHTMSSARTPSRRRYMDYSNNNITNNNVGSDISTITLPESSLKPQAKPRPDTMFYVTRDTAWRRQSTSITDIKSNNKKKDKVKYTNIETFIEPMDKEIKKKKCMNIFKRLFNRKYCVPDSNEIDAAMLNMSYNSDISSTMLDCTKYY